LWATLNQAAVAGLTTADGPTFDHLHLTGAYTDPGADRNLNVSYITVTATAGNDANNHRGLLSAIETYGTKNFTGFIESTEISAYHQGTGVVSSLYGGYYLVGSLGGGNVTYARALSVESYGSGIGTIGNIFGLYVGNMAAYNSPDMTYGVYITSSTTAVGTSKYGLWIGNQSGAATDNYSIYTGSATSVFGGKVGINDGAPAEYLDVNGNINCTGVIKIDDVQVLDGNSLNLGPDNTHGLATPYQASTGHVSFNSEGTWRTVAVITFASTDYGGGYFVFSMGGIQYGVGGAKAVLIGTFDKNGASNPTFTEISNVVTGCLVQGVADGATQLVVQMKSGAANDLYGNFSFFVMGSSRFTMVVTTPGYSD